MVVVPWTTIEKRGGLKIPLFMLLFSNNKYLLDKIKTMSYTKNFAKYYDILGWRDFSINVFKKIREYLPASRFTYLDMACGTGSLAMEILKNIKNVEIDAFDISPEMIRLAKRKSTKINFFVADMIKFRALQKYDIISCLYDSINHVDGLDIWQEIFENAFFSLKPGGIFIFDFNTVKAKKNWETDWKSEYGGYSVACENMGKKYKDKAVIKVSAFFKNKKIFEEKFVNYFYPATKIKLRLKRVGFRIIKEESNRYKTRKFIFAGK